MKLKRFLLVLKRTGMIKMFIFFVIFYVISSVVIYYVEPDITKLTDAFWYTFVASTSIGFGDFFPVTHVGRIFTVLITVFEIIVAAMIPGVVVTCYTEFLKIREKETVAQFLEKLEKLPELSREELIEISEKVKLFNK